MSQQPAARHLCSRISCLDSNVLLSEYARLEVASMGMTTGLQSNARSIAGEPGLHSFGKIFDGIEFRYTGVRNPLIAHSSSAFARAHDAYSSIAGTRTASSISPHVRPTNDIPKPEIAAQQLAELTNPLEVFCGNLLLSLSLHV